jgi:hypothetical protein
MYNKSRNIIMSNNFNTTQTYNFSPHSLCDNVVSHLNLFLKNKKNSKSSERSPYHIDKMVENCIFE